MAHALEIVHMKSSSNHHSKLLLPSTISFFDHILEWRTQHSWCPLRCRKRPGSHRTEGPRTRNIVHAGTEQDTRWKASSQVGIVTAIHRSRTHLLLRKRTMDSHIVSRYVVR